MFVLPAGLKVASGGRGRSEHSLASASAPATSHQGFLGGSSTPRAGNLALPGHVKTAGLRATPQPAAAIAAASASRGAPTGSRATPAAPAAAAGTHVGAAGIKSKPAAPAASGMLVGTGGDTMHAARTAARK